MLSEQLHELRVLSETITLRLLELEERVNKIQAEKASNVLNAQEGAEVLLSESEDRVRHLKGLLEPPQIENAPLKVVSELKEEGISEFVEHEIGLEVSPENEIIESNESSSDENHLDNAGDEFEETTYIDDPEMPLLSA